MDGGYVTFKKLLMNFPRARTSSVKIIAFLLFLSFLISGSSQSQKIVLGNNKLSISFDRDTGQLLSITDLVNAEELLNNKIQKSSPWQITLLSPSTTQMLEVTDASNFEFSQPDSSKLLLNWSNFEGIDNKRLHVTAEIGLKDNDSVSLWDISLKEIQGSKIDEVVFPRIEGIKNLGNEHLAVPVWMGQLMRNPRSNLAALQEAPKKYEWSYPGGLSMQFLGLYNPEGIGFYAAANDSLSYRKSFSLSQDTLDLLTYEMTHFPGLDSTKTSYSPDYQAIVGSFKGDWITAAEHYRKWGTKQKWSRESRLQNGEIPKWVEQTALWVWNREESKHVLPPALDLKNRLQLPVSVLWHWWHNDSYDDSFPEYFPPREGKDAFVTATKSARKEGVNALVYMNQLQWGTSTPSFNQENAAHYTVKDRNGEMKSHVYNIFTGKSLTNMCITTEFWKSKYASLAQKALSEYGVSGIYMDQACLSRMCYDKSHGHSIGGGNYWVSNSSALTKQIRTGLSKKRQTALAGEGGLESYLPYLDLFLTLQVSRERYAGIGNWETIPLFQAVYHQYGITFGSYSSLLTPPYDDKWPEEFAPEKEHALLDDEFNKQFLMEQARSFVWGMQPAIANYKPFLASKREEEINYLIDLAKVRQKGLQYLLYGKFVRTPSLDIPEERVKISRLSIYAGRGEERVTSFEDIFPSIYTGSWMSGKEKRMAIAFASISENPFEVDVTFESEEYGLSPKGNIFIVDAHGKESLASFSDGKVQINYTLKPKEICLIEIVPD